MNIINIITTAIEQWSLFSYFIGLSLLWHSQVNRDIPSKLPIPPLFFFFFLTALLLYILLWKMLSALISFTYLQILCIQQQEYWREYSHIWEHGFQPNFVVIWSLKYIKRFKMFILEYNCRRLASFPLPHYILYDVNGFAEFSFLVSLQSLSLRMRYPNFNASYILAAVVMCYTTLTFLIGLPFQFFLFTASLTCGGEVDWLPNQRMVYWKGQHGPVYL